MKIIISHDVDHQTAWEHIRDGILVKFWLRNSFELLAGSISPKNYRDMLAELISNRWQYVEPLMQFDNEHKVPATYFVGVNQGLGLSYSLSSASACIQRIIQDGFEVGMHGICFDDLQGIQEEYARFRAVSGLSDFGIRMHYLRMGNHTLADLAKAGYAYDASTFQISGPSLMDGFVEFPLHIMDVRVLYQDSRYKTVSLQLAQEFTRKVIHQVNQAGLPYLTILFHDRYFCDAFSKWREWYIWTIEHLQEQGLEFINYKNACQEVKYNLNSVGGL
jgi:peptidoglycan/xylan/chitin deacetylase (PgdA/CDA1 family)